MDAPTATLIGSWIAAAVSVLTVVVNSRIASQTLRQTTARDILKVSLELKIQQLNELYGPVLFLLEQTRRLAKKLRVGKPDEWRLLDHIHEVLTIPEEKAIVLEIQAVNARIEDLIINKGGLVYETDVPESFALFLGHARILTLALEGKERPIVDGFEYYPRDLDNYVQASYLKIKSEIAATLKHYQGELAK